MEKLKPNVVALSLGIVAAVTYVACLIIVAILPLETVVMLVNSLFHGIDFSSIATKRITLAGSIGGIIGLFAASAVFGYFFASVYNWLRGKL